jgi:predicted transcriptional regulator
VRNVSRQYRVAARPEHLAAPPETLDEDPPLADVMTRQLIGITMDADVHVALRLLTSLGVRHLPAMAEDRCQGVVFEQDVLRALAGELSVRPTPALVADLYRPVAVMAATDRRSRAAQWMARTGLDAVVVAEDDKFVGIVTATDLVRSLASVPGPRGTRHSP